MDTVSLGQAHETALTLQKAGATPEFWTRLAQNVELAKRVVAVVMSVGFWVEEKIERSMPGWTCKEPVEFKVGEFEPVLKNFFIDGERHTGGGAIISRAKNSLSPQTGLRHAEAMLREQERIPDEWRKFKLVFTEVWQHPGNGRSVLFIEWVCGRWSLNHVCLYYGFGSNYRFVSLRK